MSLSAYMKDAEIFEQLSMEDESNIRYKYYLAQSYFNTRGYDKALENYKKIIDMNQQNMETINSLQMIKECHKLLNDLTDDLIDNYPNDHNLIDNDLTDNDISFEISLSESTQTHIIKMENNEICIEIFI